MRLPNSSASSEGAASAGADGVNADWSGANDIQGLTHPAHCITAVSPLYKKRGRFAAAVRTEWVERLFVLCDTSVFWFEQGSSILPRSEPIGAQQGRIEVRHFQSINQTERSTPASATAEEVERIGPKYQLEISTITAEQSIIVGSTDKEVVDEWLAVLSKAVGQVGAGISRMLSPSGVRDSLRDDNGPVVSPKLLRLDATGLVAVGYINKARSGVIRASNKDGWPLRYLVLTDSYLFFFKKPTKRSETEDDGGIFGGFGSSLRSGEPLFGQERGRMPLAHAHVASERFVEDGVAYTYITLTAALPGQSVDSLLTKSVSRLASIADRSADRFRAVLRTSDDALAAEWCAVLRSACGASRSSQFAALNAAIASGDVSKSSVLAAELAKVAAALIGGPPQVDLSQYRTSQMDGVSDDSTHGTSQQGSRRSTARRKLPAIPPSDRAETETGECGAAAAAGAVAGAGAGAAAGSAAQEQRNSTDGAAVNRAAPTAEELRLQAELDAAQKRIRQLEEQLAMAGSTRRLVQPIPLPAALSSENLCDANSSCVGSVGSGVANTPMLDSPMDSPREADLDVPGAERFPSCVSEDVSVSWVVAESESRASWAAVAARTEGAEAPVRQIVDAEAVAASSLPRPPAPPASPAAKPATVAPALAPPAATATATATATVTTTGTAAAMATATASSTTATTTATATATASASATPTEAAAAAAAAGAATVAAAAALPSPAPAPVAVAAAASALDDSVGAMGVAIPVPPAPAAPEAPPPPPAPPPSRPDLPAAGSFSRGGWNSASEPSRRWAFTGDGPEFAVRIGPDYKKHGKKAPSLPHVYNVVASDVFRRPKILHHMASHVTLPPPPDPENTNTTGLPRRLVLNVVIPAEGPSITSFTADDSCYQIVLYMCASCEQLQAWRDAGSPASRLFMRWLKNATTEPEIKERLKLLINIDNLKEVGLNYLSKYNGKPALITKSGSVFHGDDYLEIGINTFRFSYITKKAINSHISKLRELRLHAALTIEGRENDELPEQLFAAARVRNFDLPKLAAELGKR